MKKIQIHTEYIKLSQFLKWAGICQTGGEADALILQGDISVNGAVETRRGKKLVPGDEISIYDSKYVLSGE